MVSRYPENMPARFKAWAAVNLKITNKLGRLVPLVINPAQDLVNEVWWTSGRVIVIVKGRQAGITLYLLAVAVLDFLTEEGSSIVLILDEERVTKRTLLHCDEMFENLPPRWQPDLKLDSAYEKLYQARRSHFYIGTAGQKSFGMGDRITLAICDNPAHWEKPAHIIKNITGAVIPEELGGRIVYSGTPNGADPILFSRYQQAAEARSGITRLFIPWHVSPEYRKGPRDVWDDLLPLWESDLRSERRLVEECGLDAAQIRWARSQIEDYGQYGDIGPGGGAERMFLQEHPEDDVTCFQGLGGRTVYPAMEVNRALAQATPGRLVVPYLEGTKYRVRAA